uniref:Uncharacterized protein n=1 Tax=Panulirus argus virus 1 TaxID=380624 RepID=A0A6G9HEJ9_9VIRU|nr:hypothetical protein [Panulirus argus virus 1]
MELHILFRNAQQLKKYDEAVSTFRTFVRVKKVALDDTNSLWYRSVLNAPNSSSSSSFPKIKLPLAVLFNRMGTSEPLTLERFVHLDNLASLAPLIMNGASKRTRRAFDRNTYDAGKKYVVPHNANVVLKPQSTLWQM